MFPSTFAVTSSDDRAALALLSLPLLAMIAALTVTQSFKPARHVDLTTIPASLAIPPVAALKPLAATQHLPQLKATPPAIAPSPAVSLRDIAATAPPSTTPTTPLSALPFAQATRSTVIQPNAARVTELEAKTAPTHTLPPLPSQALNQSSAPGALAPTQAAQTAMLATRAPVEINQGSLTAPLPALAARETPIEAEPNVCLAPASVLPGTNAASSSQLPASLTPAAFGTALAAAARSQTRDFVIYNDKYRAISYPRGDVQPLYGVCTDVVIRAYRALGIDLQQLVHEARIGASDPSINHRRTETLRRFFTRFGQQLPASTIAEDYRPGDIVTYNRPQNKGSRSHIAVVSDVAAASGRYMIIHNRGWGPQLEDGLFVDEITGHYRYSAAVAPPVIASIPHASPQKRPSALAKIAARDTRILADRRQDGATVNGLGR